MRAGDLEAAPPWRLCRSQSPRSPLYPAVAALYDLWFGLRGALGAFIPGPYKILWELTLMEIVVFVTRRPPT